ncbi:MAG TPA: ribonuclease H-like domain-containing protein [Methanomicrobiales archaeon]|nr:ribonuclease H-like domain-containing protein [Methanomicrobiales archaeon]
MLQTLDHVAGRWRDAVDAVPGYEVVEDGKIFRTSFLDSYVFSSEHGRALDLLRGMMKLHEGSPVGEVLPGREVETGFGPAWCIERRTGVPDLHPDREQVRRCILEQFRLLPGIGPVTEKRLRGRGYRSIHDLRDHRRFGPVAGEFLRQLDEGGTGALAGWIARRYLRSYPVALAPCGLHRRDELVFLDIETLGIFSRPIILIGIGRLAGSALSTSQYLVREISEEPAALNAALEDLTGEGAAYVSFNGKSFDIPYIGERAAYYGMPVRLDRPHFDLLHFSRRRWGGSLPDCRLSTLERQVFGISREVDIPGSLVPEFYEAFLRTGNCGPLVPIVDHNRQDLVSLGHLLSTLLGELHACR